MKKLLLVLLISFLLMSCAPQEDINITERFHPVASADTLELGTQWIDTGATMTVDGITIIGEVITNNINTTELGLYKVTYEVDYKGITYETERYVIIVDQTPPDVYLNPGIDTITRYATWVDESIVAIDNSGDTVTVTVEGTVNTSFTGTYEIIYTATDSSGNSKTISRFVHVVD